MNGPDFPNNPTLPGKIIAFHVVFESYRKEIMYFGQISSYLPGVLVTLDREIGTAIPLWDT